LAELTVGFLSVELVVGLAGGLLRVVPVVVLPIGADGAFKLEGTAGFGFVAELGKVRFGIEPAFSFGGLGLDSVGAWSTCSATSAMVDSRRRSAAAGIKQNDRSVNLGIRPMAMWK
jgi:hypothetical protein